LGNLRTAWISWSWAKTLGEPWVVRFEDIDQPRVLPGAQGSQLADLERLGMRPDRCELQSERAARHESLFQKAVETGAVYPCTCSRKEIRAALEALASAPHDEPPEYDGRCRRGAAASSAETVAWRLKGKDERGWDDFIVARTGSKLENFVPAYHWACAIDDHDGRYSLLVRAHDLAPAAELQRRIQAWICAVEGVPTAFQAVFHTALVVQNNGERLEKRTRGVTLDELEASGIGPAELLARFETTFAIGSYRREYRPGVLFGEKRETLPLSDLGLTP
jgi:glutamyl/glutaminyl-tRNA synthetase